MSLEPDAVDIPGCQCEVADGDELLMLCHEVLADIFAVISPAHMARVDRIGRVAVEVGMLCGLEQACLWPTSRFSPRSAR